MNTAFTTVVKSEVEIHVVPDGDIVAHEMDDRCVCGPFEAVMMENDHYEGSVIMHPSLDGREVPGD